MPSACRINGEKWPACAHTSVRVERDGGRNNQRPHIEKRLPQGPRVARQLRQTALQLAQILCQAVRELALPHVFSDFGCVTLSVGVATLIPLNGQTSDVLLGTADEMLYRAKAEGRNRVVGA